MSDYYLMTGAQCRMARSLLKWSRERLVKEANISRGTIRTFEDDQPVRESIILDIYNVFDSNGVECSPDGSVRPRMDGIKDFRGFGSCDRFFANIEKMLKAKPTGLACRIGCQNMLSKETGRDNRTNFERLQALSKIAPIKCLLTDRNIYLPGSAHFDVRVYQQAPISLISCDFVYGDEITFAIEQDTRFSFRQPVYMVIESSGLVRRAFEVFDLCWREATPYTPCESAMRIAEATSALSTANGFDGPRRKACY